MIKNNKGFTLVELLISMTIIAIIFALIAPLFITGIRFFGDSNNMVMDQTNLRKIMTDMSREIRDASDVTVVSSTEITVGDSTYTYNADNRNITKYLLSSDTTVVISERIDFFEITLNGAVIEFEVRAEGANSTITTKVSIRQRAVPTPNIA